MTTCTVCELHAESTFKIEGMDCREEVALIVEGVIHEAAVAARPDDTLAAQQAQLMRDGRLAHPDAGGEILHAELRARERVEDADARGVAKHLEGVGERRRRRIGQRRPFYDSGFRHLNI